MITKLILILTLSTLSLFALDSREIIQKVEDNLNGKSAYMTLTMIVHTKRYERKMTMESRSIGDEKSFIKITYPKKDEGITFLKIDNQMWQYVPKIEKTLKIPSSMMLQSWMGSDFTNDDLVRESSITKDYDHKLIDENATAYTIELIAKEDAPVVWGKILMGVDKTHFLPLDARYYDEDGTHVRTLSYTEYKQFNDRFYPAKWTMKPLTKDKSDHRTYVIIDEATFDIDIDEVYFSKNALKRFSR